MSNKDWEHAALNKEEFLVYYGKEEDVHEMLESLAKPPAESEHK
jgi:hypothetical protein